MRLAVEGNQCVVLQVVVGCWEKRTAAGSSSSSILVLDVLSRGVFDKRHLIYWVIRPVRDTEVLGFW